MVIRAAGELVCTPLRFFFPLRVHLFELLPQQFPGAGQTRHDCCHGDFNNVGNFPIRQIFELPQHDNLAGIHGQPSQGLVDNLLTRLLHHKLFGVALRHAAGQC